MPSGVGADIATTVWRDPLAYAATDDWERLLGRAFQDAAERTLSPRQQQIVRLTCDGWTVADIAGNMGLTPARISDEKYKAIHKLRSQLASA